MSAKELVHELEQVTMNYEVIATEYKDKTAADIPAEKKQVLANLAKRGRELKALVADEQKREAEAKDVAELKSFLEKPAPQVPVAATRPINDDRDGRKSLEAGGWEFKQGLAFKQTSTGQKVEMYSERVLFGPLPENEQEASYFRKTRAALQPAYRDTYNKYILTAAKGRSESMAFAQLTPAEQKALSEGQDDAGGYLVPPDVQAELLVRLPQFSVIRRYARIQSTSRDTLRYPRVAPAAATEGGLASGGASIFSSGFVGTWVGETPAFTDKDPGFGQFDISIKKARVATKLSNDFVSDSAVDILAFLARNGAENLALVEDLGFFRGDGAALQPLGILNGGASTVDVEGSTANTISNTTAATGTAPKLFDVLFAVPPQYRTARSCVWVMTPTSEGKTRKLVDANGRYQFAMSTDMGSGLGSGRALLNYTVENSPFMQEDGTDTNKVYLFGDLSAYIIAQRAQIATRVLSERFADTDQIGIILFERVGGALWNVDAVRYGIV
jgi:HK97 family phage major capsid protein